MAAYKNSVNVARILLNNMVEINSEDPKQNTALHICAMKNSKEVAELLCNHSRIITIEQI